MKKNEISLSRLTEFIGKYIGNRFEITTQMFQPLSCPANERDCTMNIVHNHKRTFITFETVYTVYCDSKCGCRCRRLCYRIHICEKSTRCLCVLNWYVFFYAVHTYPLTILRFVRRLTPQAMLFSTEQLSRSWLNSMQVGRKTLTVNEIYCKSSHCSCLINDIYFQRWFGAEPLTIDMKFFSILLNGRKHLLLSHILLCIGQQAMAILNASNWNGYQMEGLTPESSKLNRFFNY